MPQLSCRVSLLAYHGHAARSRRWASVPAVTTWLYDISGLGHPHWTQSSDRGMNATERRLQDPHPRGRLHCRCLAPRDTLQAERPGRGHPGFSSPASPEDSRRKAANQEAPPPDVRPFSTAGAWYRMRRPVTRVFPVPVAVFWKEQPGRSGRRVRRLLFLPRS